MGAIAREGRGPAPGRRTADLQIRPVGSAGPAHDQAVPFAPAVRLSCAGGPRAQSGRPPGPPPRPRERGRGHGTGGNCGKAVCAARKRCEPGLMAVAIEGIPVVYLTDRQDAQRRGSA